MSVLEHQPPTELGREIACGAVRDVRLGGVRHLAAVGVFIAAPLVLELEAELRRCHHFRSGHLRRRRSEGQDRARPAFERQPECLGGTGGSHRELHGVAVGAVEGDGAGVEDRLDQAREGGLVDLRCAATMMASPRSIATSCAAPSVLSGTSAMRLCPLAGSKANTPRTGTYVCGT